jgi:hypothetical protein
MNALILSYAQDTNGQNDRFRRAAEKFGDDPDVISAFALGATDPAGVVARFQLAADKYGGLEIRSAHRATAYFDFPHDLTWDRQTEPEIRELAQKADVIHLNNSYTAYRRFRLRKPALLHHHGSLFRSNPEHMLEIARQGKMVQAVSTPDLLRFAPDVLHWLPTAYDVDELAAFGEAHRRAPDGRIRIVQAPTNREHKATELLIAAVDELVAEGLPIDLVIVEGTTQAECLRIKATADIVFDQLEWGYGCNAVEAWAMGIPVISGSDEWTRAWMHEHWGETPYEDATAESLREVIRQVIDDHYREGVRARGIAHVRKYHDEKPALARLAELYARAIARYNVTRIPGKGKPVTFASADRSHLTYDGQDIVFVDGEHQTDDPHVIFHLRTLARRKSFGISEVA